MEYVRYSGHDPASEISKRELFAALIMAEAIGKDNPELSAEYAVICADALVKELEDTER